MTVNALKNELHSVESRLAASLADNGQLINPTAVKFFIIIVKVSAVNICFLPPRL